MHSLFSMPDQCPMKMKGSDHNASGLSTKIHPLYHLLRDRMKVLSSTLEFTNSQFVIHAIHEPEDGSAVFHPSFHYVGSIVAYDPFCCFFRKCTGSFRFGIFERELEESVSNFDIVCNSKSIDVAEMEDV